MRLGCRPTAPNQNNDEDHKRIELDGFAVNHRLEDAAFHLLVDDYVDEQHHGLPRLDEQPHDDEQRPAQRRAHQRYEVQHRDQQRQCGGIGHAKDHQHDEGDYTADYADGEVTTD